MRESPESNFPSTHATWLHGAIAGLGFPDAEQGQRAATLHVMSRYRDALIGYAGALPARMVMEPSELVAGFFATRLAAPGFFAAWRRSGLPLRRYLMTGLSLHARTALRSERREAARRRRYAAQEAREAAERSAREADAERRFERAWARAVVAEACARVRAELASRGDASAWTAFDAHVLQGEAYARILMSRPELKFDSEDAIAVAVRRVGRRVRSELRIVLTDEGVSPGELERELRLVASRLRP